MFLLMFIEPQHPARLYSAEKLIALSTPPSACSDLQIFKYGSRVVRLERTSPFQHLFNITFRKYIWHPVAYTHLQFVKAPPPQFHQRTDQWLWIITAGSISQSTALLCLMGKSIGKCWKQKSIDWQVARPAEPITAGPLWATVTAERWSGKFQLKLSWDFCVKWSPATLTRQGCPTRPWIFTSLRDRTADGPKTLSLFCELPCVNLQDFCIVNIRELLSNTAPADPSHLSVFLQIYLEPPALQHFAASRRSLFFRPLLKCRKKIQKDKRTQHLLLNSVS